MPGNNIFDVANMRLKLDDDFMDRLEDLMVRKDVPDDYLYLANAVLYIQALMDLYYTPNEKGNFPALTKDDKTLMTSLYTQAINSADRLIAAPDADFSFRAIAESLCPLMKADKEVLDGVELSDNASTTLPELIAKARKARTEPINLGVYGGNLNRRIRIRKQDKDGYFTPESRANARQDLEGLCNRLNQKYPQFGNAIEILRGISDVGLSNLSNISGVPDRDPLFLVKDLTAPDGKVPQGKRAELDKKYRDKVWGFAFLDDLFEEDNKYDAELDKIKSEKDYIAFQNEIYHALAEIGIKYSVYQDPENEGSLAVARGARIDTRNVAMSRAARFFGQPDLVADAQTVSVNQGGREIKGVFMAHVEGTDISKINSEDDPFLSYGDKNFQNPDVICKASKLQALDFICGNIDRHIGNFIVKFDNPGQPDAKIIDIVGIDNDAAFGTRGSKDIKKGRMTRPEEMGVFSWSLYETMLNTTKEAFKYALQDLELSDKEIDTAWERKEALQKQIGDDIEYFRDKPVGEIEAGHIRLVEDRPGHENEWAHYDITRLKGIDGSVFSKLAKMPEAAKTSMNKRAAENKAKKDVSNALKAVEIKEENAEVMSADEIRAVGNAVIPDKAPAPQNPDNRTVSLVMPELSSVKSVGDVSSKRYPIAYTVKTENGGTEIKRGFFTKTVSETINDRYSALFDEKAQKYPKYKEEIRRMKKHFGYSESVDKSIFNKSIFKRKDKRHKLNQKVLREIGLDTERTTAVKDDGTKEFTADFLELSKELDAEMEKLWKTQELSVNDFGMIYGENVDTKNAAMSDIAELLGRPGLLAKSERVNIICGSKVTEGTFMDEAAGIDPKNIDENSDLAKLDENQIKAAFNNPEALKSMADLQVLDYLCGNRDRHGNNFFLQFDGLDTDKPRLKAVIGIDNDMSFSTKEADADMWIDLISEDMYNRIMNPEFAERFKEMMEKNNIPQEAVDAAMQRLDSLKKNVGNKIKKVSNDDWGQGEYTLEKLSQPSNAMTAMSAKMAGRYIFINANYSCDKCIEAHNKRVNAMAENPDWKPKENKGLKFANAVRVQGFSMNVSERKELNKLEEKARRDYKRKIEQKLRNASRIEGADNPAAHISLFAERSSDICSRIKAADPTFAGCSSEYKDVISAAKRLKAISEKYSKHLNRNNGRLTDEMLETLDAQMNQLSEKMTVYKDAKKREFDRKRQRNADYQHSETTQNKLQLCNRLMTTELIELRDISIKAHLARDMKPEEYLRKGLKTSQELVQASEGAALRRYVAQTLYFRFLQNSGADMRNGYGMKSLTAPARRRAGVDELMQDPAFAKIAAMQDNDLKQLCRNPDLLEDTFFSEKAKLDRQDAELSANRQQNAPQHQNANILNH